MDTLRGCIVAEEGYVFLSLDASQIELRCLAYLSQDPQMIEDLKTGDLHQATADRMFGIIEDKEERKKRRYDAKQGNFAMVYGADEYKLSEMLECSVEDATAFMQEHKQIYPTLYKWMGEVKANAKKNGYVISPFGRIRPLPELYGGSFKVREKAEREVVNTLVQGMAVDIVKMAGLYLRGILDKSVRFLLQVHDEWLLEVPERLKEESLTKCKELDWVFPKYPFTIKVGKVYSQLEEVNV